MNDIRNIIAGQTARAGAWLRHRTRNRLFRVSFAITNALALILLLVPFLPSMPMNFLDGSYAVGINEAVGHGAIFGRDIVFTYGPYASVLSGMFHPATDRIMMSASLLTALAIATGLLGLSYRGRWWLIPLVPFSLALSPLKDGCFMLTPLLLLALAARMTLPAGHFARLPNRWPFWLTLGLLVLTNALFPLVKCSFLPGSIVCGAFAFILIVRRAPKMAALGVALYAAGLISFWLAAGQPLWALPRYIVTQIPLISDFSDGMNVPGRLYELLLYLAGATSIVLMSYRSAPGKDWDRILLHGGAGLLLYLALKASFVRHDTHAMIGASALLLAALILALPLRVKPALAMISLAGLIWGILMIGNRQSAPLTLSHFVQSFQRPVEGLVMRLDGIDFGPLYTERLANIKHGTTLAPQKGTADIYSYDQTVLIANGFDWSPRPTIQSYTAYDKALAELNAAHLTGANAPDFIYFRLQTIDQRFPSLDDGVSWLPLLSHYRFGQMEGSYARFEKLRAPGPSPLGPVIAERRYRWSEAVTIAAGEALVWAEIDIQPSLIGKLRRLFLKPPVLKIEVTFADGGSAEYRYIDAMGQSGFLLSPVLNDTREFVALLSAHRNDILRHGTVTSFRFKRSKFTSLFWQSEFHVRLRGLSLATQSEIDAAILAPETEEIMSRLSSAEAGGQCAIDAIDGKPIRRELTPISSVVTVEGWAAIAPNQGIPSEKIFVVLSEPGGGTLSVTPLRYDRQDLDTYFGHPEMGPIAYSAIIDASALHGPLELRIAQLRGGVVTICPTAAKLLR